MGGGEVVKAICPWLCVFRDGVKQFLAVATGRG